VCSIFINITAAQAGVIELEDWFDQAGSNSGGITQSQFSDELYFAVAQNVHFSTTDTYEVTEGWHIASYNEYINLMSAYTGSYTGNVMLDQDGWQGYTTASGSPNTHMFALADMFDTQLSNKAVHSGFQADEQSKHYMEIWGGRLGSGYQDRFAGLVVIQDTGAQWGKAQAVPAPSTLAIFALGMMGLASRRFKKKS